MPYYTCLWRYFLLVTWCCGSRSPISSWGLSRGWDCTNTHLLLKDTVSGLDFHFSSLSSSSAHKHTHTALSLPDFPVPSSQLSLPLSLQMVANLGLQVEQSQWVLTGLNPSPSLVSTSWLGGSHGNEKTSAFPSRFIQILPHPQQPGVPCTYYTELWRQSRTKDANPWVTFKEQQLSLRNICPLEVSFIICHDSLAHI